jgi:hypothetical protein
MAQPAHAADAARGERDQGDFWVSESATMPSHSIGAARLMGNSLGRNNCYPDKNALRLFDAPLLRSEHRHHLVTLTLCLLI